MLQINYRATCGRHRHRISDSEGFGYASMLAYALSSVARLRPAKNLTIANRSSRRKLLLPKKNQSISGFYSRRCTNRCIEQLAKTRWGKKRDIRYTLYPSSSYIRSCRYALSDLRCGHVAYSPPRRINYLPRGVNLPAAGVHACPFVSNGGGGGERSSSVIRARSPLPDNPAANSE